MKRKSQIRAIAHRVLQEHGIIRPEVNVSKLASKLGAEVRDSPTDEAMSGFLYRDSGRVVIGVNSNHHPIRQRFTIAHELGHFLLHPPRPLLVDDVAKGFKILMRDDRSSQGTEREEIEANTFAAEILMPSHFLDDDLPEGTLVGVPDHDPEFDRLRRRYGVSSRALAIRLSQLGYLQELLD